MSRSLFQGTYGSSKTRNVLNPVTTLGGAVLANDICSAGGFGFTRQEYNVVKNVQNNYTKHMESGHYENIPNNLQMYLALYGALSRARTHYKNNRDIRLLLTITMDALVGSINSYGSNMRIIELNLQVMYLQEVIEEMISGINVKPAFDMNTGGMSALKELEFAPLFKTYINTYGLPQPGDGFNINRLQLIYDDMIQNGLDPGIVNMQTIMPSGSCLTANTIVDMYRKLALYVTSVRTLQETYALGDITSVVHILTPSVYNQLSADLNSLAYDLQLSNDGTARDLENVGQPYQDYERIRLTTATGLSTLNKAVQQNSILLDTQDKLDDAQEKVDILLDPIKLKQYIEDMSKRSGSMLFPDTTIGIKKAIVKQEYVEYIKVYGFPVNGIFDPEKLGDIVNQLTGNVNELSSVRNAGTSTQTKLLSTLDTQIQAKEEIRKRLKTTADIHERIRQLQKKK